MECAKVGETFKVVYSINSIVYYI